MRAFPFAALLALATTLVGTAGDERFANVPKHAEVHVITVREPFNKGVSESDILDWHQFALQLCDDTPRARHVRKCCTDKFGDDLVRELQNTNLRVRKFEDQGIIVTRQLSFELYVAISKPNLYDAKAFAGVKLPKAVQELVDMGDKRTTFQTHRMNRDLLNVLYPECISPTPRDFQTARVTVKPGKPVVLVLCSHHQCHWIVNAEKGATVAGVFLFGGAQDVVGTDAPTHYGAVIHPNGKQTGHGNLWFGNEDAPQYAKVKRLVKDATGCDVASFQKAYSAPESPFVVKPGAK